MSSDIVYSEKKLNRNIVFEKSRVEISAFMIYHKIMKTAKRIRVFILLGAIFIILYLFFAAKPLAKEYQFTPVWNANISFPIQKVSALNEKPIHFHLGQTLGYFDSEGTITHFKTFPSKASVSDYYYATYDSSANNLPFYFPDGNQAGVIKASGYPYFAENLIYVFLPGGASFAKCDEEGNIAWQYEGVIPITAFSAKKKFTAIGLSDGTIKVFENETGTIQIIFAPGGSDYNVILGLDVSENGEYIASVSGHDQQRFVLSRKEGAQQKIIYHTFLQTDSPYRTLVHFCDDKKRVFYNYENNLGIFDLKTGKNSVVTLKSKAVSIEESDDFLYLLSKKQNEYTVSMIENTNTLAGSFSFEAETAFIHAVDNNLYVGKDNSISRLTIAK